MNIVEALEIVPRSLISLITLLLATKLLGKKQVSELSLFDYAIGISIGNFTAEMILVLDSQLINGVVAILTFGVSGYLITYLTMKSLLFRRFLIGSPTIIIENGEILYQGLKKSKIDINDLLEQARSSGYFNIKDISYAIMETNGEISFLTKDYASSPTKKDLNIKEKDTIIPINVILDGIINEENLNKHSKTKSWLLDEIKRQGFSSPNEIILGTITNNKLDLYSKNKSKTPKISLE